MVWQMVDIQLFIDLQNIELVKTSTASYTSCKEANSFNLSYLTEMHSKTCYCKTTVLYQAVYHSEKH